MSFLGTQVQSIRTDHKVFIKCYGLTVSLATKPTLVGSRTAWLSRNQFFRLEGGVTSATPSVSQTLRLDKYSANYMVLGLGTGKSQKISPKRKVQGTNATANNRRAGKVSKTLHTSEEASSYDILMYIVQDD